jgi:hypothetical protein
MRFSFLTIINRHRNPFGIFLRIPNTLLLAYGLWYHLPMALSTGVIGELSLWLLIPPVNRSFSVIDQVIELELRWMFAPMSFLKIVSFILLTAALVAIISGIWIHSVVRILTGLICFIIFNTVMRSIARRHPVQSE